MPQLFFKGQFHQAIRDGTKRTTIRRWKRPMVRAGDRAFVPGFGWLDITAVDMIELAHMADDDARADGFANARDLQMFLALLYPQSSTDGKAWFRVAFTCAELIQKPSHRPQHQ
ncbi:MAG TPA: ASCH domain-containing protein [Humisphaera sp.]|jgi:hypothetical protein|nr:ASCH domain-containing protein [Humisphaera sp.]